MNRKVDQRLYSEEYFFGACDGFQEFRESRGLVLPARLSKVASKADLADVSTILDVGCGRGELVLYFGKRGFKSIGVDYALSAIRIAKELLRENKLPNAHIVRSSSEKLEFKGDSFDLVFLNDVAEHLYPEQLAKTLEEIHRILKPNGQLVIHTMPNAFLSRPLYILIKLIGLSRGPLNPHIHVNEQTFISLRALLKKSSFKDLNFSFELNGDWFRAATAYRRAKFFVEPIIKFIEAKPFQFLISNSPLRIFLSTDIFVVAKKSSSSYSRPQSST